MNARNLIVLAVFAAVALPAIASAFFWSGWIHSSPVMAIGVSTDGQHAVTTARDGVLTLWNLDEKERIQMREDANIYSANFVPDRPAFLWQDLSRTVHVRSVDGEIIREFQTDHDTYGHLISSDLETYISTDDGWAIHVRKGDPKTTIKAHNPGNFRGFGKPFNLSFAEENGLLVSAGDGAPSYGDSEYFSFKRQEKINYRQLDGVTLWSLDTLEPIAKLPGNVSKTHATISPDGKWVVSGDENGIGLYWNTENLGKRFRVAGYHHGLYLGTHPAGHPKNRDRSGLIPVPDDANQSTIAIKFIHDSQYYLRFGYDSHTAALFEVDNPWPIKYFDLGDDPFPATASYSRNLAIDTAPRANILVMGQRDGGGILVYRFDPDELTLERVWVGR